MATASAQMNLDKYSIDDYIEAKIAGADITIPGYDQTADNLLFNGVPLSTIWRDIRKEKNPPPLPDIQDYFAKRTAGSWTGEPVPVYDKILTQLMGVKLP